MSLLILHPCPSLPFLTTHPPLFTFEPVGSVATVSTLPVWPRQQCLAFTLFLSEFHSHSRTVWSREAVRSREVRPSAQKRPHGCFRKARHEYQQSGRLPSPSCSPLFTQATSLTTSVCPATVITALPSTDQILAVLSYDPVRILQI